MRNLGFPQKQTRKLYCDNQSSIKMIDNPIQYDWTKHLKIDWSFIYKMFKEKIVEVLYVKITK
jgi:hypothetical protein